MAKHDQTVLRDALRAAKQFGATPRETKALVEAGIVESGLRNLSYGDADSVGFLQQRPSQGWKGLTDVGAAATEFLQHARELTKGGFKGSSGQLAQAVQRSRYPKRYDQVSGEAQKLLGSTGASAASGGGSDSATSNEGQASTVQPNSTAGVELLASLLQQSQPQAPLASPLQAPSFSAGPALPTGYQPASSSAGPTAPQASVVDSLLPLVSQIQGQEPAPTASPAPGASADVASPNTGPGSEGTFGKSHSPLFELIHKGDKPYAVKNGKVVDKSVFSSVWDNHAGHVHAAAGPNTIVALGKLAQSMGLHVGGNVYFTGQQDTGGHVNDSYHYRRGKTKSGKIADEAIDVSGDPQKMNLYSQRILSLYGLG